MLLWSDRIFRKQWPPIITGIVGSFFGALVKFFKVNKKNAKTRLLRMVITSFVNFEEIL